MIVEKPIILLNFRKSTETLPLRRYNIINFISNYEDLLTIMNEVLKKPVPLRQYQKFLEDYIFKTDGQSSQRVLTLIENLMNK